MLKCVASKRDGVFECVSGFYCCESNTIRPGGFAQKC